jgi:hypothetical protein
LSILFLFLQACSGCREPESIQVSGQSLELEAQKQAAQQAQQQQPTGPRVIEIRARPFAGTTEKTGSTPAGDTTMTIIPVTPTTVAKTQAPPGAVEEEALSKRLTDKLKESKIPYNENNPPKIYVSNQTISEFSNYYESKGQKVSRMSIPASVLIAPLLQEHPELAAKIDMKTIENTVINQVVVEGSGVSAADKYIDPDTLQVVDKLFVTDMPADLGK